MPQTDNLTKFGELQVIGRQHDRAKLELLMMRGLLPSSELSRQYGYYAPAMGSCHAGQLLPTALPP
jgi:hypothetical protein